jgi:hypothetical protein
MRAVENVIRLRRSILLGNRVEERGGQISAREVSVTTWIGKRISFPLSPRVPLQLALTLEFSSLPYLGQRNFKVVGNRALFLGRLIYKSTLELSGDTKVQRFSLCHRSAPK